MTTKESKEWVEEHCDVLCEKFPDTEPRMFKHAGGPILTEFEIPGVLYTICTENVCSKRRKLAARQRRITAKIIAWHRTLISPEEYVKLSEERKKQVDKIVKEYEELTEADLDLIKINSLQICGRCKEGMKDENGLEHREFVQVSAKGVLEASEESGTGGSGSGAGVRSVGAQWTTGVVQYPGRGEGSRGV